jgi:hypothetical protein
MRSIYPIAAYIAIVAIFFFLLGTYTQEPTDNPETAEIADEPQPRELIIREPQVAGGFYTSDPAVLQLQISSFLEKVPKKM